VKGPPRCRGKGAQPTLHRPPTLPGVVLALHSTRWHSAGKVTDTLIVRKLPTSAMRYARNGSERAAARMARATAVRTCQTIASREVGEECRRARSEAARASPHVRRRRAWHWQCMRSAAQAPLNETLATRSCGTYPLTHRCTRQPAQLLDASTRGGRRRSRCHGLHCQGKLGDGVDKHLHKRVCTSRSCIALPCAVRMACMLLLPMATVSSVVVAFTTNTTCYTPPTQECSQGNINCTRSLTQP
jgi:hypothetical protein